MATKALARAFPGLVAVLVGLLALTGALPAVFALLVARLVTGLPSAVREGFGSTDGRHVLVTLAAMAAVLLADELVGAARSFVQADLYRRYEEHLLARVMAATLSASRLELFEDPALAGRVERTRELARLEPGDLVDGLGAKWAAQVQGLAAIVLVATVWPVAAITLAAVWVGVGRRLQADYQRLELHASDPFRRAAYLKNLAVLPAWAKEVRTFGLVGWVAEQFAYYWKLTQAELRMARRVDRRTTIGVLVAVVISNAAVLAWAAWATTRGSLEIGALTVLVQGMFGAVMLADQEGDLLIGWGASRVPDVVDVEAAAAALRTGPVGTISAAGRPTSEIRIEGLRFAYPGGGAVVYDGLELQIEAGQSLAIVGLNGAGKTTLAKLIAGLELPQAGRISVDGIDLTDLDPESWRLSVAAIFQDFVHYDLPARDNIGFGAVEALHDADAVERATEAARRAGAEEILARLPDGLATPLSPVFAGGVDLSGGQWQRIALARAMAAVRAGARLLILDEPTAHLDVRAEADLYDRFLDLTRGLTTIVISHRFSTVRRADRIVVLDAGRVSEDGSHEQLIAAGGEYARLFGKQAMRYSNATPSPSPSPTAETKR
ncbi:MAG: ABC transporter ATP-binding protein [Actinopolymorphaceae bacterium]